MSLYATKLELTDEEKARILGDQKLAADLEQAILTEKYNDTELRNKISAEEKARAAGDSNLSKQISNEAQYREDGDDALQAQLDALQIPAVDPALYATVVAMEKGDADTLAAANTFTTEAIADIEFPEGVDLTGLASEEWVTEQIADFATENFVEEAIGAIEFPDGVDLTGYATEAYVNDAIAAIPEVSFDGYATEDFVTDAIAAIEFPAGTVVGETPPADAEEGATWYDTVRLELFVFASNAWLPCSPLGARVEQGEIVQAQILSQINVSLAEQEALRNRVGNLDETALVRDENGHTTVEQEWRLRAKTTDNSTWTFLKIGNNELGAYHLQDPKEWHHAANRRYVDDSIGRIVTLPLKRTQTHSKKTRRFRNHRTFKTLSFITERTLTLSRRFVGITKTEPSNSGTKLEAPAASVGSAIQAKKIKTIKNVWKWSGMPRQTVR